jgi:hypothetical protein
MGLGMLDPTTLAGLGISKSAPSKKGATAGVEFEEVFERTLAPPGAAPPEREVAGPEESPTNAPNARSSQMDPQPPASESKDSSYALDELRIGSVTVEELPGSPDISLLLEAEDSIFGLSPSLPNPLSPTRAEGELGLPSPSTPQFSLEIQGGSEILSHTSNSCSSAGFASSDLTSSAEGEEAKEGFAEGEPSDENGAELRTLTGDRPGGAPANGSPARSGSAGNSSTAERVEQVLGLRRLDHTDHIEVLAARNTRVRIELNPLELGPMTLQVSQEGKEIKTHVVVENPALRFALDRAQGHLTAALSEAGMNLTQFSMEKGAPQERDQAPVFATPEKLLQKQRTTYTTTTGGLEIWA